MLAFWSVLSFWWRWSPLRGLTMNVDAGRSHRPGRHTSCRATPARESSGRRSTDFPARLLRCWQPFSPGGASRNRQNRLRGGMDHGFGEPSPFGGISASLHDEQYRKTGRESEPAPEIRIHRDGLMQYLETKKDREGVWSLRGATGPSADHDATGRSEQGRRTLTGSRPTKSSHRSSASLPGNPGLEARCPGSTGNMCHRPCPARWGMSKAEKRGRGR
jgi:hypothetical protein